MELSGHMNIVVRNLWSDERTVLDANIWKKKSISGKSANNALQHRIVVRAGIKFWSMPVRQHELQHKKLWNGRRTGSPSDLFEPLNKAHGQKWQAKFRSDLYINVTYMTQEQNLKQFKNNNWAKQIFFYFLTVFYQLLLFKHRNLFPPSYKLHLFCNVTLSQHLWWLQRE